MSDYPGGLPDFQRYPPRPASQTARGMYGSGTSASRSRADDLAAVRDRLARLEEFVRRYADEFATAWLHDVADRISDERQALREIANVPRCTAPGCSELLTAVNGRGPLRRYCSPRCRKRASRAL